MSRLLRAAALAAAAVLLAALAGAGWIWRELHRPFAGWSGQAAVVVFEPGLSARAVVGRLGERRVVRHPRIVAGWVVLGGQARSLRAGEYRFAEPVTPLEVLAKIRRGEVVLHPVTLPEGLTLAEVADRFVEAGLGERQALVAAFGDPASIRDLDPRAVDLEGYLFPDTYHFPAGESPPSIVRTLVGRFWQVAGQDYVERARAAGLDLREAVTLASLIEKETSLDSERSRISRVFHNRLQRGMRLECDPTVIYALARLGREPGALTYRDLEVDSPWNTYRIAGLPPGPIANPGRGSLEAAVRPAEGDELFFVAAPGGGHRFSRTHDDHLEAVAEWRRYSRSSR